METQSLTERSVSPDRESLASSQSAEIPVHFKKDASIMRRSLTERSVSPDRESLASSQSAEIPVHFKKDASIMRRSLIERSVSPDCVSMASSQSAEIPVHFKDNMQSSPLNRPGSPSSVSLASGGSLEQPLYFTKETHGKRRTQSVSGNHTSPSRSLRPPSPTASYMSMGTAPSSQAYFTPIQNRTEESRPSPRYAGPEDVACNLCEDNKLKACKSCLTCMASFCEIHVRDHYITEPLQRHLLVEVTENLSILQENAELKKMITKVREENATLRKQLESINQVNQVKLNIPDFLFRGKTPKTANVKLDPATAHRALIISEDRRRVRLGNKKNLPQSNQRFEGWECVVATGGFSSGRHVWHVEVNKEFTVGVMKQSAPRKDRFQFTPRNGYWCLYHYWMSFTALDSPVVRLSTETVPRVLGVCVDVDERWVAFYNAETKTLLYVFKLMIFQPGEKIYPVFSTSEKSMDLEIMT